MLNTIGKGFTEHKLMRRLIMAWATAVNTWVIYISFTAPPDMNGNVVMALTAVIGLHNVAVGLYFYKRSKEEQNNAPN